MLRVVKDGKPYSNFDTTLRDGEQTPELTFL